MRVQTILTPDDSGAATFRLFSRDAAADEAAPWREHGTGTLRRAGPPSAPNGTAVEPLDAIRARCPEPAPIETTTRVVGDGHEQPNVPRREVELHWEALAGIALPAIASDRCVSAHPALRRRLDAAVGGRCRFEAGAKGRDVSPGQPRPREYPWTAGAGLAHARVSSVEGERRLSAEHPCMGEDGRIIAGSKTYAQAPVGDAMAVAARRPWRRGHGSHGAKPSSVASAG